jgi:hypothetical protein
VKTAGRKALQPAATAAVKAAIHTAARSGKGKTAPSKQDSKAADPVAPVVPRSRAAAPNRARSAG